MVIGQRPSEGSERPTSPARCIRIRYRSDYYSPEGSHSWSRAVKASTSWGDSPLGDRGENSRMTAQSAVASVGGCDPEARRHEGGGRDYRAARSSFRQRRSRLSIETSSPSWAEAPIMLSLNRSARTIAVTRRTASATGAASSPWPPG
ncbi:MAG: hypothetical protein QOE57_1213 [Acidimicrobiaceae bacterium]|nr:hypothetical protein [Acidimicrobiaceae bacterium]